MQGQVFVSVVGEDGQFNDQERNWNDGLLYKQWYLSNREWCLGYEKTFQMLSDLL